jgi:hypothetical protein
MHSPNIHSLTPFLDAGDEKDQLGIDTTMTYLTSKLNVNIENAELLLALEIVQAPTVGVITKKGYVDGWKSTGSVYTRHTACTACEE